MNSIISFRFKYLLLCVMFLMPIGCAALKSGNAPVTGAVTELNGRLIRTHEYGYRETLRAGVMVLGQMGVPAVKELSEGGDSSIKAVLPDGTPVNINIVNIGNGMTEVGVRAGSAGVWDSRAAAQLQASIGEMLSIFPKPADKSRTVTGGTESASDEPAKTAEKTARASLPTQGKKQKAAGSRRVPAGPRPQFTLFFDADSNELSARQMKMLDKIADHILKIPNARVKLNGFTDSLGNAGYNRMISEARASAVKFYLISKGISPGNIKVAGYGPVSFIADNETVAGRDKNRRVEVVIYKPKR